MIRRSTGTELWGEMKKGQPETLRGALLERLEAAVERGEWGSDPFEGLVPGSEAERRVAMLVGAALEQGRAEKRRRVCVEASVLGDVDALARVLERVAVGGFDVELPTVTLEPMDTMRIGVEDMCRRLRRMHRELEEKVEELERSQAELERHRDALQRLSYLDGLTGLNNRRRFDEYFVQADRHAAREDGWLSLLLVDIDHFKRFNDAYGHLAGDDCLRAVAVVLGANAQRPLDLAARFGGEEFALVLPETDLEGGAEVARKILSEVEGLGIVHERSPVAPHLTVSVGLATCKPQRDTTCLRLIEEADRALYQAKELGRNQLRRRLLVPGG
jgi:diguanylate cyclase (GGDEF)-like protein